MHVERVLEIKFFLDAVEVEAGGSIELEAGS